MAINSAVLSNVYNFYQADLVPRSSSNRFDAHKKKDLKEVYRSIVKISKDEPVFLMRHSKEVERYTIHMKENALRFRSDVAALGGLDDATLFNQKTAYSSDTSVATVTNAAIGELSEAELQDADAELGIDRLATPQINEGKYLPAGEAAGIDEGEYSFDVSTATSNYELQFAISPTDTNHDIQSRLARLVNNFNLGLKAKVETNGNGESALVIRSNAIGDRPGGHFSISDEETSQKGGIVDYLGIREPATEAADAVYRVNGEEYRSSSNDIGIGGLFEVHLNGLTAPGQTVKIGIKPDVESMKDNIVALTGSYNEFLRATAQYVDQQPRTNLLVKDMQFNSAFYTSSLTRLGVKQEEDGTISVDEDRLKTELKNGDPAEELNTLKDFAKFALRKAKQVQLNPMDYVDKRIVAYKDPTKQHYANPYVTSAYSGMLFNGYM